MGHRQKRATVWWHLANCAFTRCYRANIFGDFLFQTFGRDWQRYFCELECNTSQADGPRPIWGGVEMVWQRILALRQLVLDSRDGSDVGLLLCVRKRN